MVIRRAELSDIGEIVTLLECFSEESYGRYGIEFDAWSASKSAELFVKYHTTLVMEKNDCVVGVAAGGLAPCPWNHQKKIFTEGIWYVAQAYRRYGVKLYSALEQAARDSGADVMVMATMSNSMADKVGAFYERQGFQRMELHYSKVIK